MPNAFELALGAEIVDAVLPAEAALARAAVTHARAPTATTATNLDQAAHNLLAVIKSCPGGSAVDYVHAKIMATDHLLRRRGKTVAQWRLLVGSSVLMSAVEWAETGEPQYRAKLHRDADFLVEIIDTGERRGFDCVVEG